MGSHREQDLGGIAIGMEALALARAGVGAEEGPAAPEEVAKSGEEGLVAPEEAVVVESGHPGHPGRTLWR